MINTAFAVTIFRNYRALTKREQLFTLDTLRDYITRQARQTKDRLPLIKLGTFGEKSTQSGCLRSDKNIKSLSGLELDYDREKIPFDAFVATLTEARLFALLHGSPSCTLTKPRLRMLLPFKTSLREQLHRRAAFVSRIDGMFGGNIFAAESWTLSQTYYVGRDLSNLDADFRIVVIEGDYIDERDDLVPFEAISTAAREQHEAVPQTANGAHYQTDGKGKHQPIADIASGASYHPSLLRLAASAAARGVSADNAVSALQGMMDASSGAHDERWQKRRASIPRLVRSGVSKYAPAVARHSTRSVQIKSQRSLANEQATSDASLFDFLSKAKPHAG